MNQTDRRPGEAHEAWARPGKFGRLGWWFLMACIPVWLAGCATSADPHEGGFVSGVAGLAGGGYERRIDQREGSYQNELDGQQRLKAQARALEQERGQVRSDLARARERLASQERRIAQQRARLGAERTGAAQADLRRLERAQAQVASTKAQLGTVRLDKQPVSDLKTRTRHIQKELDEIDNMVGVVGGSSF